MPLLRNRQTGNLEFVGDDQTRSAVESGSHVIDPKHPVALAPIPGIAGTATSADQLLSLQAPVQPEAERRAAEEQAYEAERYSGPGEAGAAVITGAIDAATLGAFSAANRLTGDDAARSLRQHRGAYTVGQVAGAIATGRPAGAALLTPGGQAARAGAAIAGSGGIARKAAGFGVEGAIQGAGQGFGQAMIEDDLSIERIASSMKSNALIGAGGGAALGGIGGAISKARTATQRAVDAGAAARAADDAALAVQGTPVGSNSPLGQIVDDVPDMDLPAARKAEKAELGRIGEEREAEARAIVADLESARNASKAEQPWIVLRGVTSKKPRAASAATTPTPAAVPGAPPTLPDLPALKPKKLSSRVGRAAFEHTTPDGTAIPMRIQTTTRHSDLPDFGPGAGELVDGRPAWTHVEVQQKLSDGTWGTVGDLQLRHRGDTLRVENIHAADQWRGSGLEERMIRAAERRLGRRVTGQDAHPLDAGPVDEFLAARQQKAAARALSRGQRVPSWDELTTAGRPVVTKTVPMADLAPRLVSQFDIAPPRRLTMAEEWRASGKAEPPVIVVRPDGGLDISEGYGRLLAAMEAGEKRVKVELVAGAAADQTDWTRRFFPDAQAPAKRRGKTPPIPVTKELEAQIKKVAAMSFQADKKIDKILGNPDNFATRPKAVLEALQQQGTAYEKLAELAPDLRARIMAQGRPGRRDHRLDALGTLDANLARNRTLQARVKAIIADPDSARLSAIRGQREDLVAAAQQPKSLMQSLAEGATFAGATAAAAPLGMGAPLVGAHIARTVGQRLFRRMANVGTKAAQATTRALDAVVKAGKVARPAAVPLSTATLRDTRFGPEKEKKARPAEKGRPAPDALTSAFMQRRGELLDQVEMGLDGRLQMRMDARQRIADGLVGVAAFSPSLADKLETAMVARIEFLANKLPKPPDFGGMQLGPNLWRPSSLEMRTFARYVAAAEDPDGVEQRVADATISPEDAETYRALYPERFADYSAGLSQRLAGLEEPLPFRRRIALSLFTGVPLEPSMAPQIAAVLQASHQMEPGSAGGATPPTPQPQFGSIKAEEPTSSQKRWG